MLNVECFSLVVRTILVLSVAGMASAADSASISMRVQPLSYLSARPGTPSPLLVTLDNPNPSFEGILVAEFVRGERQIPAGSHAWRQIVQIGKGRFAFTCYPRVTSDDSDPSVRVALFDPRGRLVHANQTIPLRSRPSRLLVLAVPATQRHLALPPLDSRLFSAVPVRDPGLLPDRWYGYKSFDAVFWDASRTDKLSADQQRALADWVCGGGRLILAACRGDTLLLSPVPSLVPSLEDLSAAGPGEIPLSPSNIERRGFGLGEVLLLKADYAALASADRAYLGRLFAGAADALDEAAAEDPETGYRAESWNVSTFARNFLATMAGYGRLNYTPILVLLLIYIVVVAVADYWILKRLKRLPWTWYTFPALILAFSVVSYFSFYHGALVSLGRYDFRYVDVGRGGHQRCLTLSCVRSNRNRIFHCAVPVTHLVGPLSAGPEYEYDYRYGRTPRNRPQTPTADLVRMDGSRAVEIPGLVGSFCFFAEEWTSLPAEETPFLCRLQRAAGGIKGDIVPRVKGVERAFLVLRRGPDAGRGRRIYRLDVGRDTLTFDPNRLARTDPPEVALHAHYRGRHLAFPSPSVESWASYVTWEAERQMRLPASAGRGTDGRRTARPLAGARTPFDGLGDDEAVILAVMKESSVSGSLPGKCVTCIRQIVNIPSETTP